ncbi:MAG: L,D-transpeptidase family protein [Magnetococcales bacterium]|nr:L,D-transpeptidase family protein [Magnetococcales bacterium]
MISSGPSFRPLVIGTVVLAALLAGGLWPDGTPVPEGIHADRVVLHKSRRLLILFRKEQVLREYTVSLGRQPTGPKEQEGDNRTPEGSYRLDSRMANSAYHRSLHVSYPNAEDSARAGQRGVSPGGAIFLHGLPNGLGWLGRWHRLLDWTRGCVALTNREIEELWQAVPADTPIEILP